MKDLQRLPRARCPASRRRSRSSTTSSCSRRGRTRDGRPGVARRAGTSCRGETPKTLLGGPEEPRAAAERGQQEPRSLQERRHAGLPRRRPSSCARTSPARGRSRRRWRRIRDYVASTSPPSCRVHLTGHARPRSPAPTSDIVAGQIESLTLALGRHLRRDGAHVPVGEGRLPRDPAERRCRSSSSSA